MRAVALGALVVLAACGDDPVPGPGTLTASVVSPNGDEGAAALILSGVGVSSVSSFGDTEAYASIDEGTGLTRVVLINEPGGQLTFRVSVANVLEPPNGILEQVAGPDDALRDPTGYRVEFAR